MSAHVGIDGTTWRNDRGFGRFTRSLVEALAARNSGFSYSLVCDQKPEHPVPANVEVVVAGSGSTPASRFQMHQATVRLGCDVFFYPAVYSFYPVLSRARKVVCIHDTIPERYPDLIFPSKANFMLWRLKTSIAKLQATRFLTGSDASVEDLHDLHGIPKDRIDLTTLAAAPVFRPIDDRDVLDDIRRDIGVPEGARILVYVGGFNRHKNVIKLIQAFPQILRRHTDTFLAIVGRTTGDRFWDNIEDLEASARSDAKAADRIVFTGEISDEQLVHLMNAAYALAHPSLCEGFGLPLIEAMACGTPVLGSNMSAVPEVVGNGGLLFDPTDPGSIADTAIALLDDPALRARLSDQALKRAADFTWDRAAAMTEESFEKALQG